MKNGRGEREVGGGKVNTGGCAISKVPRGSVIGKCCRQCGRDPRVAPVRA